jgi:hypothetical protein
VALLRGEPAERQILGARFTAIVQNYFAIVVRNLKLTTFTQSVETLLQQIMQWHDSQFARHLPGFYPLFVDLMHCDSKELRQILRDIFANRVGDMVNNKAPAS